MHPQECQNTLIINYPNRAVNNVIILSIAIIQPSLQLLFIKRQTIYFVVCSHMCNVYVHNSQLLQNQLKGQLNTCCKHVYNVTINVTLQRVDCLYHVIKLLPH